LLLSFGDWTSLSIEHTTLSGYHLLYSRIYLLHMGHISKR
jgi:hypothetical protein